MKSLLGKLGVILAFIGLFIFGYGCPLANAQCAWVLWERQHFITEEGKVANPGEWGIVSAYPRYEQFLERQRQAFINFKEEEGYRVISRPFEYSSRYKEGGKWSFLQELKCLPDTVDPRK